MDLTASIEARSDQINADDLISGPATYTIREVVNGKAESPFDFMLVETERAYRPSKTMRRVIVACLGPDASKYPGVRLTIYREPTIQFGGKTVGGIRISHMSGITKRVEVMAQVTRGKRETFIVDPLPDAPAATNTPTPDELAAQVVTGIADSTTEAEVREWGNRANSRNLLDVQVDGETVRNHVTHRLAELAETDSGDPA